MVMKSEIMVISEKYYVLDLKGHTNVYASPVF